MRLNKLYFLFLVSFIAAIGCKKDNGLSGSGEGVVGLYLKAGNIYTIAPMGMPSEEESSAFDTLKFKLTVRNSDSVIVKVVDTLSTKNNQISLMAKNYSFKVESGKLVEKGYDMPYYVAEQKVSVKADIVTPIEMKLKLGNIKVTVEYDQSLKQYLTNCETVVKCGDNELPFVMDETRSGYFKPSEKDIIDLKWTLSMFPISGAEQVESGIVSNVKANEHIKLKFAVEDGDNLTGGLRIIAIKVVEDVIPGTDNNLNIGVSRYPEVSLLQGDINEIQNVVSSSVEALTVQLAAFPEIEKAEMQGNVKILDDEMIDGRYLDIIYILTSPEGKTVADLKEKGIEIKYLPENSIEKCKNPIEIKFDVKFLQNLGITADSQEPYTFKFTVIAKDGKKVSKSLIFNKINSDVVTIVPAKSEVWSTKIEFKGRWLDVKPNSMSFSYSADKGTVWESINAGVIDDQNKTFSATVKGLKPATEYWFRAVGNSGSNLVKVVTEAALGLNNGNMDKWSMEGKAWYARESSSYPFWDSGNKGGSMVGGNPTQPEESDIIAGKAAKLNSLDIVNNFAAGNLFTGEFINVDILTQTPDMTFGRPFTSRPYSLKGFYKYISTVINKDGIGMSGKNDRFNMFILITNGDNMPRRLNTKNKSPFDLAKIMDTGTDGNVKAIASGVFTNENISNGNDVTPPLKMNSYEKFEIVLKYHENYKNLEPKYIVVVFSASKYGDFFTGGVGSTLYLDELELDYDFK